MAIFLTLTILQLISMPQGIPFAELLSIFVLQFLIGGIMGYLFGILLPSILKSTAFRAIMGFILFLVLHGFYYSLVRRHFLGGNGFLAVYIAGIAANAGIYP